jgi:hypothetical protein
MRRHLVGKFLASAVLSGSEPRRTHSHIFQPHDSRFLQSGGPGPHNYCHIHKEQDVPVISSDTVFPFVASYNSQGYGQGIRTRTKVKVILRPKVSRPVCLGVRHSVLFFRFFFFSLSIDSCGFVDVGRPS